MKTILLKKLFLLNFKGTKSLEIEFNNETNIFGANETGKTTVFDAFLWLLFGKDSTDRKDFQVKTLDRNNQVIEKIDHEVSATLEVNGTNIVLRRVLREKWVKQKGNLEATFTGNETLYYWNEIPMQQKEFQLRISEICDEFVFKLISNPAAFNALKWQDRRDTLIKIAGQISDQDLINANPEYQLLIEKLSKFKNADEYKRMLSESVKRAKEDIKMIPSRIDEVERSKPANIDFDELRNQLSEKQFELKTIDDQIEDKTKATDAVIRNISAQRIQVQNIKSQIDDIEFEVKRQAKQKATPDTAALDSIKAKLAGKESDLQTANDTLTSLQRSLIDRKSELSQLDQSIVSKRNLWTEENSKELNIDDSAFCCPTCKRDFDPTDVETKKSELIQNFNDSKTKTLLQINEDGKKLNVSKSEKENEISILEGRIEKGKDLIQSITSEIQVVKSEIETAESNINQPSKTYDDFVVEMLLDNADHGRLKEELKKLEESIPESPVVDVEDLKASKNSINSEIQIINAELAQESQIEFANKRIEQLNAEQKTLAQQIADVDKDIFLYEEFAKLRVEEIERRVRSKFKIVSFKMFESQINGGESETCVTLINGVPYSDANTASKINAGLDIINTLSEFYQVQAPVFIDNRESITKLIDSNSQIINLIVSPEDKKLRIETK